MNNTSISFLLKSKKLTDTQILQSILLRNNQDFQEFYNEYDAFIDEFHGESDSKDINSVIHSQSIHRTWGSTRGTKGKKDDLSAILDSPNYLNIPIIQSSLAYSSDELITMIKNAETLASPANSANTSVINAKSFFSGIFQGNSKSTSIQNQEQKIEDTSVLKWISLLGASLRREKKDISSIFPVIATKKYFFLEETKVVVLEVIASFLFENKNVSKPDFLSILTFLEKNTGSDKSTTIKRLSGKIFYYLFKNTLEKLTKIDFYLSLFIKMMDDKDVETRTYYALACGEMCFCTMDKTNSENTNQDLEIDNKESDSSKEKSKKNVASFQNLLSIFTNAFSKSSSPKFHESIAITIIRFLSRCPEFIIVSNLHNFWSQIGTLMTSTKLSSKEKNQLEIQYFLGSIIRIGITQRLSENGQQISLIELTHLIQSQNLRDFALVCALKELALLCKYLGEKIIQFKQNLLDTLFSCLRNRSYYIRVSASFCMRVIAESISDQSSSIVSALLNMVQMTIAEMAADSYQNQERYVSSLHGHSLALSAVISVSSTNPISISYDLCSASLDTATLMFSIHKNMSENVKTMRKSSCWMLISSLMFLDDFWIEINFEKVLDLWHVELGGTLPIPENDDDIDFMIQRRTSALFSIYQFLKHCGSAFSSKHIPQILIYLNNSIKILTSLPVQSFDGSSLQISILSFKRILYRIFNLIPISQLSTKENSHMLKFITKVAFSDSDGSNFVKQFSIITSILESNTTPLTLNFSHKNMFSETPFYFQIYGSSLHFAVEWDPSLVLKSSNSFFLKKPQSLQVQVTTSATKLIGKIFMHHKSTLRIQMIDHLQSRLDILKDLPAEDALQSSIIYSNVISVIHEILKNMPIQELKDENKAYMTQITSILFNCLISKHRSIRVASAVCFEYMAKHFGSLLVDEFIVRCSDLIVQASSGIQINLSGYALALGHMYKSLSTFITVDTASIVSYLLSMTKTNCKETTSCALHSLAIIIESSGMTYEEHLNSTLQSLRMVLYSKQSNLPLDHTLLACAEIFYALLMIGPELINNTQFVQLFSQVYPLFLLKSNPSIILGLNIKLIHRIALLAPGLIPIKNAILSLRDYFFIYENTQERNMLLASAIECLTVISQIKPDYIDTKIYDLNTLFKLLDQIQDNSLSKEIKIFIKNVLQNNQRSIKEWLTVITRVSKSTDSSFVYRWQTQLFALKCLEILIQNCRNIEDQCDPQKASSKRDKDQFYDALVFHLKDIVSLCANQATIGNVSLQKKSISLLGLILEIFEHTKDIEDNSSLILQPFSIHFSTAIGSGFSDVASPSLLYDTSKLLARYISSKIISDDDLSMKRLLNLLITRANAFEKNSLNFGETANTMVKVTILGTIAKIFNKAQTSNDKSILDVLSVSLSNYTSQWENLINDYIYISVTNEMNEDFAFVLENKSIPRNFYSEGTEKTVLPFFKITFGDVLASLARIPNDKLSIDGSILLGTCIRALYSIINQQNLKAPISNLELDLIYACLDTFIHFTMRSDFLQTINQDFILEIIFVISRLQDSRIIGVHYQCLQLLKYIIKLSDVSSIFEENNFTSLLCECFLKPIRMYVPVLFQSGSSSILTCDTEYTLNEEQHTIVKKSMSCLRSFLKRFPMMDESFGNIIFTITTLVEFDGITSCKDTIMTLISSKKSKDFNKSNWIGILDTVIHHFIERIQTGTVRQYTEILVLYISLMQLNQVADTKIQQNILYHVSSSIRNRLVFTNPNPTEKECKQIFIILYGIQDTIVALSQQGYKENIIPFITPFIGNIIKLLVDITRRHETSIPDRESFEIKIVPCCLNIMLALNGILNNEQTKLFVFASLLGVISLLLEYTSNYESKSTTFIRKLCVDCVQRFIQNSPQETKLLMSQLNPNVVQTISKSIKFSSNTQPTASPSSSSWSFKSTQ